MSRKNNRTTITQLLIACLVAMALIAAPVGLAAMPDDGVQLAARAELGKYGHGPQPPGQAVIVGSGLTAA